MVRDDMEGLPICLLVLRVVTVVIVKVIPPCRISVRVVIKRFLLTVVHSRLMLLTELVVLYELTLMLLLLMRVIIFIILSLSSLTS